MKESKCQKIQTQILNLPERLVSFVFHVDHGFVFNMGGFVVVTHKHNMFSLISLWCKIQFNVTQCKCSLRF